MLFALGSNGSKVPVVASIAATLFLTTEPTPQKVPPAKTLLPELVIDNTL